MHNAAMAARSLGYQCDTDSDSEICRQLKLERESVGASSGSTLIIIQSWKKEMIKKEEVS